MVTKHTHGTWVAIIDDITNEHPVMKGFPEHENICMVNSSSCFGNRESTESEANAKLIAAAPELLDALCAVLRSYEAACPERYYSDDNVALADDVIKKAIG